MLCGWTGDAWGCKVISWIPARRVVSQNMVRFSRDLRYVIIAVSQQYRVVV